MSTLFTIVPRLPPSTDGVGDYSLYLARKLQQDFGLKTHFIVCDPLWESQPEVQGFRATHLKERSTSALLQLLQTDFPETKQLFLHYVGYGYARWGCPNWLLNALKTWRSQSGHQLVTMFHELYTLPGKQPWKHPFWNSHVQQSITKQLAQISGHSITSGQQYAEILDRFRVNPDNPTPYFPVFSTVGELTQVPSWDDREPILIIFGQAINKRRAYTESQEQLQSICQRFQIEEIVDVGPSTGLNLTKLGTTPFREAGKLTIEEINALFSRSRLGFFNYNTDYLAKSTIFAAYCTYGLLPISATQSMHSYDGIISGYHYWSLKDDNHSPQEIVDQAYQWYQSHSLSAQAGYFAKLLMSDRSAAASSIF
jgi:hypothetical protein